MIRPALRVLLLSGLAITLLATSCGGDSGSETSVTEAADGSLEGTSLAGEPVTIDVAGGQDTLLWFWAPW